MTRYNNMLTGILPSVAILSILMSCTPIKEVNLDEAPDSLSVDVKKNEKIKIYAKENTTTGYTWDIKLDSTSVKLHSNDYKREEVPPGFVGAGGTRIYLLEAQKKGLSTIVLSWGRGWLPQADKVKKVTLSIQ